MVRTSTSGDKELARFRAAVVSTYGARLERALLFGSRARGEGRPDSDYDVAVFLRDLDDRWREMDRLADIATDILYDEGAVIHAFAYPAGAYANQTPLMHEIRRDGIDL